MALDLTGVPIYKYKDMAVVNDYLLSPEDTKRLLAQTGQALTSYGDYNQGNQGLRGLDLESAVSRFQGDRSYRTAIATQEANTAKQNAYVEQLRPLLKGRNPAQEDIKFISDAIASGRNLTQADLQAYASGSTVPQGTSFGLTPEQAQAQQAAFAAAQKKANPQNYLPEPTVVTSAAIAPVKAAGGTIRQNASGRFDVLNSQGQVLYSGKTQADAKSWADSVQLPVLTTTTPSTSITPEKLSAAKSVNVPGAVPTTDQATPLVAGATTALADIMKQLTPAETPTEKKQQGFLDEIANLTKQEAQKSADQLTAEQSAGLPALRTQFADINNQIVTRAAEYEVLRKANENKPITMSSIIGNDRAILNAKAADIGLLQARALGLQGQIETAQNTVNRAIDLKYDTIENQLKVYGAQLAALEPTLNKEEKQLALAQKILLDERTQAINAEKDREKSIQNLMLEAIKAGVTDSKVLGAISSADTVEQALAVYGKNAPAPEVNTQVVDLGNKKVLINSKTGEIIKDLGATTKTTLSSTPVVVPTGNGQGGQIDLTTAFQFATSNLTKDARENATKTFNGFVNKGQTAEAKQYIDKLLMDKLSATQKEEVNTMGTVSQLANQILAYNQDGKLEGVGFATGTLGQIADKVFGNATPEERNVRILVGNIKGTIAKLRGGTSFTTNEEKLLESYTPTINENSTVVINKLQSLQDFINRKKDETLYGGQAVIFNPPLTTNSNVTVETVKNKYGISY